MLQRGTRMAAHGEITALLSPGCGLVQLMLPVLAYGFIEDKELQA